MPPLVFSSPNPYLDHHAPFPYGMLVSSHILLTSIVKTWLLHTGPCVTLLRHQRATPPSSFPSSPVFPPHMDHMDLG